MAGIGGRLSENAFTDAGFMAVDDVVASALKRGRNGEGYRVGIHLTGSTVTVDLLPADMSDIREQITNTVTPELAVVAVSGVLHQAINRSRNNDAREY